MADPLDVIADLCAFTERQHAPGSPEARIADRLRPWLDGGAAGGMTLEEALGLKPERGGAPWWVLEARRKRDAAIRALAQPFETESFSEQARRVLSAAGRYRKVRWKRDRARDADYRDPRNRALRDLLSATDGQVPSDRTVRGVLSAGKETPVCLPTGRGPISGSEVQRDEPERQ